jgi:hypothetical protein
MKTQLYVLIILLIALSLRLYPTLISGMPFSTDGWPIIRNTELLMHNTPIPLNSNIFDGYNDFWPANSLFGTILSQITNLPPIYTMALGIPIVAALTIPIFYLLTQKITQNKKIALIATALLATAFPYALFTAGITKETFASPIYISLILIFLLKHNWKTTALFSITSVALVLSHHLTAFLAVVIISSLTIASYASKKNPPEKTNTNKSNIIYVAILATIASLYFMLYAYPGFKMTITPSDLLAAGAYQIAVIAATLYIIHLSRKESSIITLIKCSLAFTMIFLFFFLITKISVLPAAPTLPVYYFLFATPFIIAVPLTIFTLNQIHEKHFSLLLPLFWLLPVIAFAFYGLFANPSDGVGFAYRSINFMLPPLTILLGIGLYKLNKAPKHINARKVAAIVASVIILSMVAINIYSLYATVSLQEPYLGYFWRYEPSEYKASSWITTNANNQTISGDSKVSYLLRGYFNQNVSIIDGLNYLDGNGSAPQMLYVYNQMYKNGYVLYEGSPATLPLNWTDKLTYYNLIYANSEVAVYAK